jgi:hypothetical protein
VCDQLGRKLCVPFGKGLHKQCRLRRLHPSQQLSQRAGALRPLPHAEPETSAICVRNDCREQPTALRLTLQKNTRREQPPFSPLLRRGTLALRFYTLANSRDAQPYSGQRKQNDCRHSRTGGDAKTAVLANVVPVEIVFTPAVERCGKIEHTIAKMRVPQ